MCVMSTCLNEDIEQTMHKMTVVLLTIKFIIYLEEDNKTRNPDPVITFCHGSQDVMKAQLI